MSCIERLLDEIGREAQREVQSALRGFFGGMLRHYLPQTWVFATEKGSTTLRVNEQGEVAVSAGAADPADVTISVDHEPLRVALASRKKGAAPPESLRVTTHTAKGKAAFGYLRGRLGL